MFGPLGSRTVVMGFVFAVCLSSIVSPSRAAQTEPTPTAMPANAAQVKVEAKTDGIGFRRQSISEEHLNNGDTRQAGKGDGVNVNQGGEAWLHFPQALLVRLFRDSQILNFEGRADPNLPLIDRFFLEVGTIFGAPDATEVAKVKMTVDTQWATITDVGTRFLVYYDQQHQVTWVVVVDGAVQITAGGVTIIVPAGWQTWAEPGGRPPEPPIPASRAIIGDRFPTVDFLTNNAIPDRDVLANQQCTVIGAGLNTRQGPGPRFKIADVLRRGERFEAMRRTNDGVQPTWIYGITPRGVWGWVDSSFVRCDYLVSQLSSSAPPALFSGWPIPVTPAITPTPLPTNTPIPTATPTATPRRRPSSATVTPTVTAVPPTAVPPPAVPPKVVPPPLPPPYALNIQLPPALASVSPISTNSEAASLFSIPLAGILLLALVIGENRRIYSSMRSSMTWFIDKIKRILSFWRTP